MSLTPGLAPVGREKSVLDSAPQIFFPSRVLVFNGAAAGHGTGNLIALLENGSVVAETFLPGRGASERFAPATRALLERAGWGGSVLGKNLDINLEKNGSENEKTRERPPLCVIAVTGPGSFTGLRASLALAAGLARGWSCPAYGVSLGSAVRATLNRPEAAVLCLARRGRIFVDPPTGAPYGLPIGEVAPERWRVVAGDAVAGPDALSDLLTRLENGPEILPCAMPDAIGILRAAQEGKTLPLSPLYVDPPEAKPPAGGLRPAPV